MTDFVKNRKIFYIISATLVVASIVMFCVFGLKLGMDFVGGSSLELNTENVEITNDQISGLFKESGISEIIVSKVGDGGVLIRTKEITEEQHQELISKLQAQFPGIEENRFESLGPSVGKELKNKSITGIIFVLVGICLYLTYAFRKVSKPIASWKYGVATLVALLHDVIIPSGIFVLLSHFFKWEIDSTFITAILVILGFSVHDTIVVMDRIREKLKIQPGLDFDSTVNLSIKETMARSINTSLTLVLVLLALIVFGPASLQTFVLVLLMGTIFGTYSSMFIASSLLVDWNRFDRRRLNKK